MSDALDHAALTPLFDADGKLRMARFMTATISSMVVITVATAALVHAAAPDGGWTVAFGIGAMIGFWMCPLAGAVVGNGYHEIAKDRAKLRAADAVGATTPTTPAGPSRPETAQPTSHAGRLDQHEPAPSADADRDVPVG